MSSMSERCLALQTQLDRLRQTQANHEKAKSIGTRRQELEERNVELACLAGAASVLVHHKHLVPTLLPNIEKARQNCTAVLQRLESDPETLTQGRDYSKLLERLDTIRETLRKQTSAAWSEFVKKHEGGDERFLGQVEQVPGQAEIVATIRRARAQLNGAAAAVPQTEAQYEQFIRCSQVLQQALDSLNPEEFPAAVLTFFKRAQSPGGAPIGLLTDEVRTWLDRKGMLGGLRVRFDKGG